MDSSGVSESYYNLGVDAQRRGNHDIAEEWFRKSLEIDERNGDEHGMALNFHCLGAVLSEVGEDLDAAEKWLWKSLQIREKQGDEFRAAQSYHFLGFVAWRREEFDAAEKWYSKSLRIKEELGDEIGMAGVLYSLSQNARDQCNTAIANEQLQKALQILEGRGDRSAAMKQGKIAEGRGAFEDAEKLYRKALEIDHEATWWDWLALYAWLWRRRFLDRVM